MERWPSILSLILPFVALGAGSAFAAEGGGTAREGAGFFGRETRRFGITYTNFSGDKDESLSGGSGFGLEAGITRGNRFVQFIGKIRLDYSAGNVEFADGSSKTKLDYKLLGTAGALGLRLTPITSSDPAGFAIYFGAVGTFGIEQLTLPDRTYTSLKRNQTSTATGYDLLAGIDFGAFSSGKRLYLEAALRTARGDFGGKSSFQLDGLVLQGGLAW
ncbi:MAG: hypothetical protein JST04_11235 [Bdellovibrionales bacterium]|nr:hypothetical protein [Bdellovibrionales bacterium]